jgi:hypothetical protein
MSTQRICRFLATTISLSTIGSISLVAQAQAAPKSGFSEFVSCAGTILFVGGGSLLPLITDAKRVDNIRCGWLTH